MSINWEREKLTLKKSISEFEQQKLLIKEHVLSYCQTIVINMLGRYTEAVVLNFSQWSEDEQAKAIMDVSNSITLHAQPILHVFSNTFDFSPSPQEIIIRIISGVPRSGIHSQETRMKLATCITQLSPFLLQKMTIDSSVSDHSNTNGLITVYDHTFVSFDNLTQR